MIAAWIVKLLLAVCLSQGVQVADWGTVDGHKDCKALIGDTSVVLCADGYVTTS